MPSFHGVAYSFDIDIDLTIIMFVFIEVRLYQLIFPDELVV